MRGAAPDTAVHRRALKREVVALVALVLLADGAFIALYYALGLARAGTRLRLGYALLWTGVTLVIVLRALGRIRAARLRLRR